jgi:hypothetical protein
MTRSQAFAKAGKLARERAEPMFVVFDPSSEDGPWQVATEFDLDTYFLGCTNVTEVELVD